MTSAEARSIIESSENAPPPALRGKSGSDLDTAWNDWIAAHDAAVRARLARGDEDSVVNLWLYGTSFTARQRATDQELARRGAAQAEQLLIERLDDLVAAMADPGDNERVRFARRVVERHRIDVTKPDGQDRARELLVGLRARAIEEANRYAAAARAAATKDRAGALDAYATMYSDRGLSSDTSLPVDFALDRAVTELSMVADHQPVRRAAIVGPGLDFTDKAEGYDLYPPQTIQPFALAESLLRSKLATEGHLHLATFDVSPRVNDHLRAAAERGRAGIPYTLQLPLGRDDKTHDWLPALERYWETFGGTVGSPAPPIGVMPSAGRVDVRAVTVRPRVAAAIVTHDLNIVIQRLAPLPEAEQFDLIVATNVLVYYDRFEQALALANVAAMLRPGGIFLTNYQVHPAPPLEPAAGLVTPVFWDRQKNGDTIFGYRVLPRR